MFEHRVSEDFVSNKRRFNSVALNSDNDDNDERETKKCRLSSSPNNKRKNSYNEDKAAPAAKRHAYYFTLAPADDKDVVDQGWSESEYDSFHDRETGKIIDQRRKLFINKQSTIC